MSVNHVARVQHRRVTCAFAVKGSGRCHLRSDSVYQKVQCRRNDGSRL